MKLYRITNLWSGQHLEVHAGSRRVALNRVLDRDSLYSESGNKGESILNICIADLGKVFKMHVLACDMAASHECNRDGCDAIVEHTYMVKQAEMNAFMTANPFALTGGQYKKVCGAAWRNRMALDAARRRDSDLGEIPYDELKRQAAEDLGYRGR